MSTDDIAGGKLPEVTPLEAQAMARIAGRLAGIGAWRVDLPDLRITWSDEVCDIHGVPHGYSPPLQEAFRFYAPEYRSIIAAAFGACANRGTPYDMELQILNASGERVWVRAIGEAARDAQGAIIQVQGAFQDISDRKHAEEEARRLAARLTTTLESITDGFFTVDQEWRFTFLNRESERVCGRSREELAGRVLWTEFPAIIGTKTEREYRRAMAEKRTVTFEEFYPTYDIWLGVHAYPSEQGLAVSFRDITEGKRVEETLRRSQQTLHKVIDGLGPTTFVGLMTPDGVLVEANLPVLLAAGVRPEDVLGRPFDQTHWWAHSVPVQEQLRAAITRAAAGESSRYDVRVLGRDDQLIDIDFSLQPMRDETGAVVFLVPSASVITERKQMETALRESNAKFVLMADNITDAYWIRTADMRDVLYLSPAFERIWGRPPQELYANPGNWSNYTMLEDRERVVAAFAALMADVPSLDIEYRIVRPDGEIRWIRARGFQVRDSDGTLIRLTGIVTDITDRQRAAEALRQSLEEFRTLAEAMPQIVWIARADGENTYFNQQWMDYTGLTHDESLQQGWGKALHPDDEARVWQAWERATASSELYACECRLRRADGVFRWWLARGVALKDDSGATIKWLGTCTDIHDIKLAELEISRTNKALRMLSSSAGASAATGTAFFEQLARNMTEALGAHAGFVAQLLPGEPLSARTIAAVVEGSVTANFDYAIVKGSPCEDVYTSNAFFIAKDLAGEFPGSRVAATGMQAYVGQRLNSSSGQPLGLLFALFQEPLKELEFITSTFQIFAARAASELERQQTDDQVREQAALLDIAHEAIQVKDLEGRVIYWNKGAERTYGWTAAETIGRKSAELLYKDLARFKDAERALLANGEWQGEMLKHTKLGTDIIVEARWTLVRDSQGRPKSILAIDTDITERKQLESQFLRAQRMESIGTLAGGIAHDLNNVLSPILMSVETLKDLARDENDLSLLATLQGSAQRGAELVRQVLSFARGVEGQRITVNPLHIMRDLLQVMLETFPKSVNVTFKPARDLWTVTGDPTQMHQVFLNLCVNARDAMPDGGDLTVVMENVEIDQTYAAMNSDAKPGAYVLVKVVDTGTGIPPQIRDRVFEPFFTTKEIGKGTGLGLSTTMAIVKSHGGFIHLYSEVGKGTRFRVYLPANTTQVAADNAVVDRSRLPRGNGELILVVDDDAAIREIARRTLERFGYTVLRATNGAEAVALYAQQGSAIAAVLTDMAMPVMDGPATIVALKAMNPDVKIIGSSGFASKGGVAKAVGAGVQHFLAKPYTAAALLGILYSMLGGEHKS